MEEPSVLDYVKSILFFWRKERIQIPGADFESGPEAERQTQPVSEPGPSSEASQAVDAEVKPARRVIFPSGSGGVLARLLGIVTLAILAQRALEPPGRSVTLGVVFYLLAVVLLVWSNFRGEWAIADQPPVSKQTDPLSVRQLGFWAFIPLCALAFFLFGNNLFTKTNVFVWLLGLGAFLYAFWLPSRSKPTWWGRIRNAWGQFFSQGIRFSPWTLLVLAVFAIAAFYRFYHLNQVPAEMFSDHAEKLLDVRDVLNGQTSIFFPRNTGREAIQMYLTAAMAIIFKTGLSFMSLKLGTAFCGLFTLPFIYLIGKEIANRRVGLLAMFFAGIAYWPNVISRVALRFTLYPTFTAPMLYFLLRGLRRGNRNDFILSGLFLGLGLHGYSPFRFVPIFVVIAVFIYVLHPQSKGIRKETLWGLVMVALTSFIIFLPLLRYSISNPEMFSYRMMTRMGQAERAFPGPPVQIFFDNLWKAIVMPIWDDGQIWVHSIPNRPALEIVSAAFFVVGVVLLVLRYIRKRNWLDMLLLVGIPFLMMPSVLSLAFPDENPSLNRTGGALVIIFLVVAMGFDGLLTTLKSRQLSSGGKWIAWGIGVMFLTWSMAQNYDLVFDQYALQFKTNAWNTSELGAVIREFADSYGAEDSAWVIPYPYWVDTRLVGIRAGFPERDYALWRENIVDTVGDPRPKLFLVKPEDTETIDLLRELYPTGVLRLFKSQVEGRDFYMYSVPPSE
jgi:hypothetical protein